MNTRRPFASRLSSLIGVLALGASLGSGATAEASAILTLTVGASSLSCDTGLAFTGTNCDPADGFQTSAFSNTIVLTAPGGLLFAGYRIASATVDGFQAGETALVNDTKSSVTHQSGTDPLVFLFGVYDFNLNSQAVEFSASQTADWASSNIGDTSSFTGYARDDNGKGAAPGVGGVTAVTPVIVSTGGNTVPFSSSSPDIFWANSGGLFSMIGEETISLGVGKTGSFTGTMITTVVPEPGAMILFGTGLVGLASAVRRRMGKTQRS